ncbi:MAG: hypothetical protein WCT37_05055 [Patescibacteria group bacterium]|jgi:hypothetical protein
MSKTGNSASKARHEQAKKGTAVNMRRKLSVKGKQLARMKKAREAK